MNKNQKKELFNFLFTLALIILGFWTFGSLRGVKKVDSLTMVADASIPAITSSKASYLPTKITVAALPKVATRKPVIIKKPSPTSMVLASDSLALAGTATSTPIIISNASSTSSTSTPTETPTSTPTPTPTPTPTSTPIVSTTFAQTLPYSVGTFGNSFKTGDGWTGWWDDLSESNDVLTIGANSAVTENGALLKGSDAWSNYTVQANVDWIRGDSFSLVARYVDDKNYVACEFTEPTVGRVREILSQYINGKEYRLAVGDLQNYNQQGGGGIVAGIEVQEGQGQCSFNGHAISTVFANSHLSAPFAGQVGFKTWYGESYNGEIVVHSVGITTQAYDLGDFIDQSLAY